jgi:hypothetical protein
MLFVAFGDLEMNGVQPVCRLRVGQFHRHTDSKFRHCRGLGDVNVAPLMFSSVEHFS